MNSQEQNKYKIGLIGAGAWGSALALNFVRAGHDIAAWVRKESLVHDFSNGNHPALGQQDALKSISCHMDMTHLCSCDLLLLGVSAQAMRDIIPEIKTHFSEDIPLVITAKGIDQRSGKLLSEVVRAQLSNPLLFLSGPSFADDVAKGLPTAVALSGDHHNLVENFARSLSTDKLKLYGNLDPIGTQLGGAIKNVLAIAAGIVEGFGLGDSARAALITRGFVEMQRVADVFGAQAQTLYGLSGLGDLLLTANSPLSRNFSYGIHIGKAAAQNLELPAPIKTTEGIATVSAIMEIVRDKKLNAPICSAVCAILQEEISVAEAMNALMQRSNIWE